jgi:plastocyanin/FtsP/CotA-like multicopper oxidase with cupredoxin domain
MPDIHFWIQIENHAWDVSPRGIDRMTNNHFPPTPKTLTSPVTGVTRTRNMFNPLPEDALILRRYTENWAAPDDRKVNPWDLNEIDPSDNGTMGTIPGPIIECNVGDRVFVHFRNQDTRANKDVKARTHSLHPHGFVFASTSDGAYPLSPPDQTQPVAAEAPLWANLGLTQFKKGDRVPPGGTFTYTWNTFGWPTTAGVWLYHDHSICDMENVNLGAIGIIVIHNPNDPDDVNPQDLPPNGRLVTFRCLPIDKGIPVLPHLAELLGISATHQHVPGVPELQHTPAITPAAIPPLPLPAGPVLPTPPAFLGPPVPAPDPNLPDPDRTFSRGDFLIEVAEDLTSLRRFCFPIYVQPPRRALYLQLYHELTGQGMCINGRKYLGNTPTLIGGTSSTMRFGLVGMGNSSSFHTLHLHGHRWVIPGPGGSGVGIQSNVQDNAVSQFEDTRTFGPANSFMFTVNQGSFMGSIFTPDPSQAPGKGEWHMHCHVLNHMMEGMMGSLLIIDGGEFAGPLPVGEPCPPDTGGNGGGGTGGGGVTVHLTTGDQFSPQNVMINAGQTVSWQWDAAVQHSVTSDVSGAFDSGIQTGPTFTKTFAGPGVFPYHCQLHGASGGIGMAGTITVM